MGVRQQTSPLTKNDVPGYTSVPFARQRMYWPQHIPTSTAFVKGTSRHQRRRITNHFGGFGNVNGGKTEPEIIDCFLSFFLFLLLFFLSRLVSSYVGDTKFVIAVDIVNSP